MRFYDIEGGICPHPKDKLFEQQTYTQSTKNLIICRICGKVVDKVDK